MKEEFLNETHIILIKMLHFCDSLFYSANYMQRFYFSYQERLKLAQEELMETQRLLDKAKGKLAEVEEGIASLQAKYDECIAKKEDLEFKTNQCTARLERAEKVIIDCCTVFSRLD